MALDWRDLRREGRLTFEMVSPNDTSQVYGELEGVELSGSSLSAAYYTDTRTSGKITVVGEGYKYRQSFIRVTYSIPSWGFTRVLGTYLVKNDDGKRENGAWVYELELQSMLYGLSTEKGVQPWTLAKGADAIKTIRQIVGAAANGKVKLKEHDVKPHKLSQPLVLEYGSTVLARLYDLCKVSGNRIDVDGYAGVTLSRYVEPDKRTPTLTIDLSDPRGIAQDGVELSTNWHEMVSVAAVSYKYTAQTTTDGKTESVQREVNGWATISRSEHQSQSNRGWTVTSFESLSDVENPTKAMADKKAKENLAKASREQVEWRLTTMFIPVWEGDVVNLVVPDGMSAYRGTRKCLVKAVELDLEYMTMELTLKETASGDDEEVTT